MTLTIYGAPIAQMAVADVNTNDVLRTLKPLWLAKPETASRLRGRIERVLDFAKARGMRTGENPARWRGHLDTLLPKRQLLIRGHHKVMPFDDVPRFITKLRAMDGVGPKALEFTILTAAGRCWVRDGMRSTLRAAPDCACTSDEGHTIASSAAFGPYD